MLDKSIPYKHMIMRLPHGENRRDALPDLPGGYAFRLCRPGDRQNWAAIELSVNEFDTVDAALSYFDERFAPYPDELYKRMLFIEADGVPVATTTAWYVEHGGRRQAALHWVAVRPEHQGKGLGRAVTSGALSLLKRYEPGRDVYPHTQTWSHVAVGLYLSQGFHLVSHDTLGDKKNECAEALAILEPMMPAPVFERLRLSVRP